MPDSPKKIMHDWTSAEADWNAFFSRVLTTLVDLQRRYDSGEEFDPHATAAINLATMLMHDAAAAGEHEELQAIGAVASLMAVAGRAG